MLWDARPETDVISNIALCSPKQGTNTNSAHAICFSRQAATDVSALPTWSKQGTILGDQTYVQEKASPVPVEALCKSQAAEHAFLNW